MFVWGIMGGSFDPVHNGHLQMALAARDQLHLDGVLWIPAGDPPHKPNLAPAVDRLEMVRIATGGIHGFRVSDVEVSRGGVTYTADTMRQLRAERPEDEYVYIIGADTLFYLETWRTFAQVAPLLRGIACAPREGIDKTDADAQMERLQKTYALRIDWLKGEKWDISSTEIRRMIARGLPVGDLVPPAVKAYIARHALYTDPLVNALRRVLTPSRYRHTLGVERTALCLADRHGLNREKAGIAALLHDCAKSLSDRETRVLLEPKGLLPLSERERVPGLTHAIAGMVLAERKYGVRDPEVLSAIRWHTTGRAGMSPLEKLIYLADKTEPNRGDFPGLSEMRDAAAESLDKGMRLAGEQTLRYLDAKGLTPNRNAVELLEEYTKEERA